MGDWQSHSTAKYLVGLKEDCGIPSRAELGKAQIDG
jgi:hypothetical protein